MQKKRGEHITPFGLKRNYEYLETSFFAALVLNHKHPMMLYFFKFCADGVLEYWNDVMVE
jgi:hypothetical protein